MRRGKLAYFCIDNTRRIPVEAAEALAHPT
jgi:hypothetical protein